MAELVPKPLEYILGTIKLPLAFANGIKDSFSGVADPLEKIAHSPAERISYRTGQAAYYVAIAGDC